MQIQDFKKDYIKEELGIEEKYGKIFSFIDFGNVNYWFKNDTQDYDFKKIKNNEKLVINIEKLKEISDIISIESRIYYGFDPIKESSRNFISKLKSTFGANKAYTKEIQKIKHHLNDLEKLSNTRDIKNDNIGDFVLIPKCNFDVEISVDVIKTLNYYDTICLWSGDADFVYLLRYLKSKGKKIILIKSGHITNDLRKISNKIINAQQLKSKITEIKSKKSP